MKLELRFRKHHNDVLLTCEHETESEILDTLGNKPDEDGLIATGTYEIRLADGYAEHYIMLKGEDT